MEDIVATALALVAPGRGLLAMDESNGTCNERFARWGITQSVENRRAYREMIVTTPGLEDCISGVIFYDETIRESTRTGVSLVKVLTDVGIIPGIKVDTGAKDMAGFAGERITEGLDGLRDRLRTYRQLGARFAKWRAVIAIGDGSPDSRLHASQRARPRPVRRHVPRGSHRPRRRARSAHGGLAHHGALRRGDGGGPALGL
jgi:fructose-bisphosphate aldolase class I